MDSTNQMRITTDVQFSDVQVRDPSSVRILSIGDCFGSEVRFIVLSSLKTTDSKVIAQLAIQVGFSVVLCHFDSHCIILELLVSDLR